MATPESIKLIEEYTTKGRWISITRSGDGSYMISGVPKQVVPNAQYNLHTVVLDKYLIGPDKQGKFEIADVANGNMPASCELPSALSIGVQELTPKTLEYLLHPDKFEIGFSGEIKEKSPANV